MRAALKNLVMSLSPARAPLVSPPRAVFSLDRRALALFRIGLGVTLALDTLMRWGDLRAHYTNFGVLPMGSAVSEFVHELHASLHFASGTLGWQLILFSLTLVLSFAVACGLRTRLSTCGAWLLLVSVQNRNPLLLNGGDVLLRLLFFWAMFLPLGRVWSVDAIGRRVTNGDDAQPQATSPLYFGGGSIAYVLQIALVYLSTVALKTGKEWWPDGTASYYALSLDQFTTTFGRALVQWPELLRVSTYIVYGLEGAAGFLILCPFFFPSVRTLTIVLLALMHLNFNAAMRLGLFPWIDILSLMPLVPTPVLDALATLLLTPSRQRQLTRVSSWLARQARRQSMGWAWSATNCATDKPSEAGRIGGVLALVALFYCALWNAMTVPWLGVTLKEPWNHIGQVLRLDQKWNMFAPYPMKDDGWYVIDAKLVDGTRVDAFSGEERAVNWDKPADIAAMYPNARWRKYMMSLWLKDKAGLRLYFGKWLCRSWNEERTEQKKLARFDVVFFHERTPPPDAVATVEKLVIWQHECFGKAPVSDETDAVD